MIEHGLRSAGGDTCTLYLLDEAGKQLELAGARGVASEVLDNIRIVSDTEGNPATMAAMKAGRSIWAENEADYRAVYPALAQLQGKPAAKTDEGRLGPRR